MTKPLLNYCLVTQNLASIIEDSEYDIDRFPDVSDISGEVIFTPNIANGKAYQLVDSRGESYTVPVSRIQAKIINGKITHESNPGVYLFAAGVGSNPDKITYRAEYRNLRSGELSFSLSPLKFEAIPGGEVDLTLATPVVGATPAGIVRGPQGPQGIQGEVGPQGIQGEVGPKGDTGEVGPAATIISQEVLPDGDVRVKFSDGIVVTIPSAEDGESPYIKDGNWWVGNQDTGVAADVNLDDLRTTFVERGDLMVDVTDYGAVGDGVTDDTTAIQEAITAAGTGTVNFPTGNYLVSSGLSGFWQPRKRGPGILTDGTYKYYIEPFHFGHVNTIWANSDTGSDSSGDGLFPGTALASLEGVKNVFSYFHDQGGRGSWKVRLSGNNFSGYTFAAMPYFRNTLVIEGDPLDGVSPVTTITYDPGKSTFGMRFEPSDALKVKVRNLRFEGFPGYGLIAKGGGLIRAYDCVADGCGIGFAAINNVTYVFSRCVAQNSTNDGFRAQYSSSGIWTHCHSRNNVMHGFFISRNAVGHLDDSVAEGNGLYGLLADMNTRIATIGSSFKRNSYGVRCEGGSEWHRDDTRMNNLYVGTADANGVSVGFFGNSRLTALHSIYGAAEFRIYSKYFNVSSLVKGPGSDILLANPPSTSTIPADVFMDAQKRIRVKFWGRANSVGARSVEVRLGDPNWTRSSTGVTIPLKATSYGFFYGEVKISPRGAGYAMDGFSKFEEHGVAASLQLLNFAFDATSGVKVRIYANLQDAGSDIRLDGLELSVTG